jgi:TorA maturation chaperone TorD
MFVGWAVRFKLPSSARTPSATRAPGHEGAPAHVLRQTASMDLPREDLSAVHLLLANLFLREADEGLLTQLAQPEIADVLDLLEPGAAAYLQETRWNAAALDELAAEYARLFLLPKGVSPYAVAWIGGEEGATRARLGEEIGVLHEALRVRPTDFGVGNVPADHIGMLLALSAVALQTESTPTEGGLAARVRTLLRPWASQFSAALVEGTENPLYRSAARLLEAVLSEPA